MQRIERRRLCLAGACALAAAGGVLAVPPTVVEDELWVNVHDDGVGTDYVAGVAIDSAGNVLGAEYLAATPGSDGALVRWLHDGSVEWVERLDNPAADAADSKSGDSYASVCVDRFDDVIVGGSWSGNYYGGDWFHNTAILRKYGPDGDFVWEWKGDATYEAWASVRAVAADAAGNVYAAGNAFMSWGNDQHNWAVWKLGPDGQMQSGFPLYYNYSWNFVIADIAFAIAVADDGSFVVAGVRGEADNADSAKRDLDWHVRRYAADGSLVWEDTYQGAAHLYDYARAIVLDANGDVYVAGYTNVGTDNSAGADWDGLLIKYAKDTGQRTWTQGISSGAQRHDQCLAMTLGPGGNPLLVRVASAFGGTVNDTALELRAASDGSLLASHAFAPAASTVGYAVAYRDGLIALGGYVQGPTSLDLLGALFETPNLAPVLDEPPTASASLAAVGEAVRFHAAAHDPEGVPVALDWDFGDGATATGTDPVHAYAAPGPRHVVVTASDGTATTSGALDLVVGEPLVDPSVGATVNFRRPGRDTLTLRAVVPLPGTFEPEGREITIDAGGVVRTFTLDRKGKARTSAGSVALTFKKKKAQWSLLVQLAKGDYAPSWEDEELTSRTTKREQVFLKATVDFSGEYRCAHVVSGLYTAKEGKSGTLK